MKLKIRAILGTLAIIAGMCTRMLSVSAAPMVQASQVVPEGKAKLVDFLRGIKGKHRREWINSPDSTGDYPITCATDFETLVYLIKNGANVNVQGTRGRTALHRFIIFAAVSGDVQYLRAINYLLDHGARRNIVDSKGLTPFRLLKCMLDNTANVEMKCRIQSYIDQLRIPGGRLRVSIDKDTILRFFK